MLLAFLEDPGAANFLGPVLDGMVAAGSNVRLYAEGTGAARLEAMGIAYRDAVDMGSAGDAVRREAPWAVLVGTSENLDTAAFDLIAAARVEGVPSVAGIDSAANAGFRFRGRTSDPLAHAPDLLLLTDEMARKNFVALGFEADRITVCGHPYYDTVREIGKALALWGREALRARLFPRAGSRLIVVFLSEISDGLNPGQFQKSADYTLHGRGGARGRTEIVLEEFLDAGAALCPRPYLVLRPHPKNTDGELAAYYDEFDAVSRHAESLEVVFAADLVVGMSTSLLVETALLGRPTMSIVPRAQERDWLPTTAVGTTPCIMQRADITPALAEALKGDTNSVESLFPPGATVRAKESLAGIRGRCI